MNPIADTDLAKSDQEIFKEIDAPLKKARESMVAKMLTHDDQGNPVKMKDYGKMTTRELHLIAENISVRLNAFYQ